MDLQEEREKNIALLQHSLETLKKTSRAYAEAERDYKILLRQEILKLKDEGVPSTIINLICYGIPSVAEARFKRDCAEGVYKANQEAINTYKLKIRLIEAQLSREWVNDTPR